MNHSSLYKTVLARLRSIVVAAGFPRFARPLLTLAPVIALLQAYVFILLSSYYVGESLAEGH